MLMNIDTFIDMKTWNITGDVENQSLKKTWPWNINFFNKT